MLSMRGPRLWSMTLASTSRPCRAEPTFTSPPSAKSKTRPSLTEEPGSALMRSTRIRSPGATRYCLPPLTTTAESEPSGLGTATNCTRVLPIDGAVGRSAGGAQASPALRERHRPSPQQHRLREPERGQRRDRRGAAVRDQRQRDARDREQADVHPDVLHDLDEDHGEHARGQQLAEAVGRDAGGAKQAQQQDAEQRQQSEAAQQAELLGEGGEHEVGGAFGHEAELPLQALQPAASEQPACADRDSRLQKVVARAQGILRGVEEDLEA